MLGIGNSCCCQTCAVTEDTFARADNSDINYGSPCGWTVDQGSFSISDLALVPSGPNCIARCSVPAESGNVCVALESSGVIVDGNMVRLMINYTDKDNCYIAEFVEGVRWRIITRSGGVETIVLDVPFTDAIFDGWQTAQPGQVVQFSHAFGSPYFAWFDPSTNIMYATKDVTFAQYIATPLPALSSLQVAIGTGSTWTSGDYQNFDDFMIYRFASDKSGCFSWQPCYSCAAPPSVNLQVVIAGVAHPDLAHMPSPQNCTTCPSINGTYILQWAGIRGYNTFNSEAGVPIPTCIWRYQFPSTTCNFHYLIVGAMPTGAPAHAPSWGSWTAILTPYDPGFFYRSGSTPVDEIFPQFQYNSSTGLPTGPVDCNGVSGFVLTRDLLYDEALVCDWSHATVTITAVPF